MLEEVLFLHSQPEKSLIDGVNLYEGDCDLWYFSSGELHVFDPRSIGVYKNVSGS